MSNPTQPPHDSGSGERAVRDALAELVALKDLKDRVDGIIDEADATNGPQIRERNSLVNEYMRRKPLAWAAARAALATPSQAPEPAAAKALEFAEYMAKGGEQLLEAINTRFGAVEARDNLEGDASEDDLIAADQRIDRAEEALSDFMRGFSADIYEFRKRAAKVGPSQAVASALQVPAVPALTAWLPMESAPTDGTSVLLLIEGGEHPLQDDDPSVSIGSFGTEGGPVEDPTWNFAGWSWHQDCYCRGTGTPIGWMPHATAAPAHPVVQPAPECQQCHQPKTLNPHPKAGDPSLEFGYVWECIPCLVRTRSSAVKRYCAAEAALKELQAGHQAGASLLLACDSTSRAATFQDRVDPWLLACFGETIARDKQERSHRFIEEALELVQACGCTASEAHQLVDYVFGRQIGERAQEVGGVMVTLAALCLAHGIDMHAAGETELARIWTKVEAIRAKQAAKPKHSPLPASKPSPSSAGVPLPGASGQDETTLLREALRDMLWSAESNPSCQARMVSRCLCRGCCIVRARAALHHTGTAGSTTPEESEESSSTSGSGVSVEAREQSSDRAGA